MKRFMTMLCCVVAAAAIALAAASASAETWETCDDITVNITSPANNYVVVPTELVEIQATKTDNDRGSVSGVTADSAVAITWSGPNVEQGSVGDTLDWQAPTSTGDKTLTATADDTGTTHTPGGDDTAKTAQVVLRVATVQLESVTFGGTKKRTLWKKDANQWNGATENYTTRYGQPCANKCWVRAPAFKDPICYPKDSSGAECTASIELSITPALTRAVTVDVLGVWGEAEDFVEINLTLAQRGQATFTY